MYENRTSEFINQVLYQAPRAYAPIYGSSGYPNLRGVIFLYEIEDGTLMLAEVQGLPEGTGDCGERIFGFHIHEGVSCTGTAQDPFADAKGHYNPGGCPHPEHAGDLPPLFGNRGMAWSAFYTERFLPEEVLGRTVIIHAMPDDFHTQPSGNSGEKIACGVIAEY